MREHLARFDSSKSFLGYFTRFKNIYTPDLNPVIYPYLSLKRPADNHTDRHKISNRPMNEWADGRKYYTATHGNSTFGLQPHALCTITGHVI